jgi:hypothetical protein
LKTYRTAIFGGIAILILAGCADPEPVAEPLPGFRPTSTIKDVMLSVIDPSADAVWLSVATIVDLDGIHEDFPETDEDWAEVRTHAIKIIEGSNLLLIPGRMVAEPGAISEFPGIELEPEEIQELIDQDPAMWVELAHGLHDMASDTLAAIEARNLLVVFRSALYAPPLSGNAPTTSP